MSSFDVDTEPLSAVQIDDAYLFSEYFELQELLDQLSESSTSDVARFEVPVDEYESVVAILAEFYYEPVVVEDPADFRVGTAKYDEHAELLKRSVVHWERQGHRFLLMRSPLAVDKAIERGTTPLVETAFVLESWVSPMMQ